MRSKLTRAGLGEAFINVALCILYGAFAYSHVLSFARHHRASVILIVCIEALFAVFFLVRRPAKAASLDATACVSTAVGTFLPLLLRPTADPQDFLAAQLVQAVGAASSVAGVLSLNRSLGLLPANRGIRAAGAYRLVRHPLYASYLVTQLGYLASNLSAWNSAAIAVGFAAQLVRIRSEERLLSVDPAYLAYTTRTRWRLVPFVY
jgi:protein-S-isoprenylcysteine O-methyltransferase Ste14